MTCSPHSDAARGWSTVACQYHPHGHRPTPAPVTFLYRRADPLCVQATFHSPRSGAVVWDLGRDLLIAGTRALTGEGDVCIWPASAATRNGLVGAATGSEDGRALLSLDRTQLSAWLMTTCLLAPPGTEEDHLDWTLMDRLLANR
ncbi:SsgA family sporulation/cell division regulator [Streptomyces sp. NPDC051109]|uniref:SsgA family sporulation/cell division regulator n=1 Tax=Streptomyces sp. NPDC051109 TaxID=3365642 RepID=UPI0037A054BD